MYLTGMITLYQGYDEPMCIYFTPNHRLVMNDQSYLCSNGYIVKYDTNGNAQWCNQLYSNNIRNTRFLSDSEISDNYIFVLGRADHSRFYNGNEYVELTSPISGQTSKTFVVKFNKETGQYSSHGIVPNETSTNVLPNIARPPKPAIINNHIFATSAIGLGMYSKDFVIARFRKDDCQFVDVLDTLYFTNIPSVKETGSIRGNKQGDMFINFCMGSNTMRLGNLPLVYISDDNAVFALKNDPRLLTNSIVETPANSNIIIYPNPVTNELKIKNIECRIKNVEILDVTGKILTNRYVLLTNSINVSSLLQGVYLIKIYTDKGVVTERFIKN